MRVWKIGLHGVPYEFLNVNYLFQPDYVAPVQEEEKRAAGTISVKYYLKYFYSGGGVFGLIVLVLANILAQLAFIMSDWWLAYW